MTATLALSLLFPFSPQHHSYAGMLSMVAAGKLQPTRLVEEVGSVADAGKLLSDMTEYNSLGFSVINDWDSGAAAIAA